MVGNVGEILPYADIKKKKELVAAVREVRAPRSRILKSRHPRTAEARGRAA